MTFICDGLITKVLFSFPCGQRVSVHPATNLFGTSMRTQVSCVAEALGQIITDNINIFRRDKFYPCVPMNYNVAGIETQIRSFFNEVKKILSSSDEDQIPMAQPALQRIGRKLSLDTNLYNSICTW